MSVVLGLSAEKVEQDPKLTLAPAGDDDFDLNDMSAVDLMETGVTGMVLTLNGTPEAIASGKRTKQIHKKGEVSVDALKFKYNVDFRGGSLLNLRIVTLKDNKEIGGDAAAAAAGAGVADGESASAAPVAAAPTAGRKRARKEPTKPEDLDIRTHLQVAHDACIAQGKEEEAAALKVLIDKY